MTIGALNGFTGIVALSVSGLPAGATASFAPASAAGGGPSTLTITTTAATAGGSYPLTITATSGAVTHAANITLVVSAPPDFLIAVMPSNQAVVAGVNASYAATIGALNGFAGSVALT